MKKLIKTKYLIHIRLIREQTIVESSTFLSIGKHGFRKGSIKKQGTLIITTPLLRKET